MVHAKVSESARERETFRYEASLLSKSFINDTTGLSDAADLTSSSDTALTAFAQLGALRLGAQRCLISLFDQSRQHIVAEATPDSALGSNEANVLGHKSSVLLLSGTAIPRSFGVCEEVLSHDEQPPVPDGLMGTPSAKQRGVDLPVLIVRDLQADERFNKRGWVRQTGHGFYAGVPIRSQRGINIGVYCVLGDKPRDGLDAVSIHFLQDMSQTVMSYLQSRATGKSFQRSVRMVRGLGSLVEGKASISKWWLEDNPESFENAGRGEGTLNAKQQAIQRDEENPVSMPPPLPRHMPPSSPLDSPSGRRDSPAPPLNNNGANNSNAGNRSDSRSDSISLDGSVATDRHTPLSITDPTTTATYQREDESTIAIKSLFSKAANIIRESVELEGVLFLDAVISSFGGLVVQSGEESQGNSGESQREAFTSSGEESKEGSSLPAADVFCNVLGFSVGGSSSIDGEKSILPHATVHEKFVKGLLRRYPEGHIFNFDESGAMQSGDSEDDLSAVLSAAIPHDDGEAGPKRRKPRKTEGEVLISMFSEARSVALIPLWDSHKERWFSGGFAWTRTPTRVLTAQGELSYLKALGMVVMSEVARINTLRADQAKADVLGSLSHELRSPLHGLILGAELLHDTSLDGFQEDVVLTIENCGRTLADTMDHLLDFSKVNHSVKYGGKNRNDNSGTSMQRFSRAGAGPTSLVSDINLASLAEEVVESVYAGFSFQKASNTMKAGGMPLTTAYATPVRRFDSLGTMDMFTRSGTPPRMGPVVSVHLHIDSRVDWGFHTQPGALRRIIMNLFGNALKYTSRGSIDISLTQDMSARSARSRRRAVILSISDSGKGISAEYLRTQLFSPFAQEDHLAPGVGLGLSLVKQIISTLRGNISVDSEVGRGTIIRVTLPLRQSRPNSFETPSPAEADFLGQAKALEGVKVCLLGFADLQNTDYPASPIGERISPRTLFGRICTSWLRMEVFPEADLAHASPSLYLCPEEALNKVPQHETASQVLPPVIVVCRNAVIAHELANSSAPTNRIFEYISQPAGPRKLAKVFNLALKRHATLLDSVSKAPGLPAPAMAAPAAEPIPKQEPPVNQVQSLNITPPITNLSPSQIQHTVAPDGVVLDGATPTPAQQMRSTFLLVDDNAINLKVLVSYMNKLERPFETAMNGLEALEAFRQNPQIYRCIFMDVSMPIMDGMEAARLIRQFERQQNLQPVVIIALTGLGSSSTQEEAFASGIDLFLTKPVRLKELGRVLENYTM